MSGGRVNQVQSNFLRDAVPAAQQSQRAYGVPASVTLAQAILESGWGASALTRKANNYFGIKAAANADPDSYAEFETTEFVDGRETRVMARFARYPSPAASFEAHARLLAFAPRYMPAMARERDPLGFAEQLQACGYSTNPSYAGELKKLMAEYDLTQYDVYPPAAPAAGEPPCN